MNTLERRKIGPLASKAVEDALSGYMERPLRLYLERLMPAKERTYQHRDIPYTTGASDHVMISSALWRLSAEVTLDRVRCLPWGRSSRFSATTWDFRENPIRREGTSVTGLSEFRSWSLSFPVTKRFSPFPCRYARSPESGITDIGSVAGTNFWKPDARRRFYV